YYAPNIGRFTQEDTFRGDGLNLYVYVSNNPVKYVYPSGHCKDGAGNSSQNSPRAYYTGSYPYSSYEDNGPVDLVESVKLEGLGSPEEDDIYIKVGRVTATGGDFGAVMDGSIVKAKIHNLDLGNYDDILDLDGSYARGSAGIMADIQNRQDGRGGVLNVEAYAAIVEGSATFDAQGTNHRVKIGLSPGLGSVGGHFKAGVNYVDENEIRHYFDLEVGGAWGIGVIAEIDITDEGDGKEYYRDPSDMTIEFAH
uniref:RHS repeat-associated core domain-containing protein n=1 Tax=Sporosalibacterium faouarense TaxID=516123 RepID=UPI002435912D